MDSSTEPKKARLSAFRERDRWKLHTPHPRALMSLSPYTLEEAARKFFPNGHWTVSSLRTEIRKGRLRPLRIAGTFDLTESAIREWCQESPKVHVSGSTGLQDIQPHGSSSIRESKLAQDAARLTNEKLKKAFARYIAEKHKFPEGPIHR